MLDISLTFTVSLGEKRYGVDNNWTAGLEAQLQPLCRKGLFYIFHFAINSSICLNADNCWTFEIVKVHTEDFRRLDESVIWKLMLIIFIDSRHFSADFLDVRNVSNDFHIYFITFHWVSHVLITFPLMFI